MAPDWRRPIPLRGGGHAVLSIRDGRCTATIEATPEEWTGIGGMPGCTADDSRRAWRNAHRFIAAAMAGRPGATIDPDPEAVVVGPDWARTAVDGAGLLPALSHALGIRCIAAFTPQAWINDFAVTVDAEGDTSFDATDSFAAMIGTGGLDEYLEVLADCREAPEWIREWSGPFVMDASIRESEWRASLGDGRGGL